MRTILPGGRFGRSSPPPSRRNSRVYPDLEAKQRAAEIVLTALAADPARLRRLAGWDWIAAAEASLLPRE